METQTQDKMEVYHKDFNLEKKDNLDQLPEAKAVFGIFAIVNNEPVNCRYVSQTTNLRKSVKELFENSSSAGLKRFMQGAWTQMLVFETLENQSAGQVESLVKEWTKKFEPKIDDEGEYPGYYDY